MNLDYVGFQKPRLIELADEIYKCKGKRQELELELSSEEFHKSYIPKNKKMAEGRIRGVLPLFIVTNALMLLSLLIIIYYIVNASSIRQHTEEGMGFDAANAAMGIGVLFSFIIIVLGIFLWIKLFRDKINMFLKLHKSTSAEKAMRFAKKHDIKTYQDDEVRCNERINTLKLEIGALNEKIKEYEKEQNELIEDAKNKENVLKKYGVISDEKPETVEYKDKLSFKLKESEIGGGDAVELSEFYMKEESFIRYVIEDLRIKVVNVDKEIAMIDNDFEIMKKRVFIFLGALLITAIIQNAFSGVLKNITALICFCAGLFIALSLEKYCFAPLIRYLAEHEHPLMAEYAFVNNIVPARRRKEVLVNQIKQQEELLDDIKKKKEMLRSLEV